MVGARPNFMKIDPILRAMANQPEYFSQILVHTGQHYDTNMSKIFFDELEMPAPDVYLEVGSGSHAAQTAEIMKRFEPVLLEYKPDWVVVVGDVNSTLACALVAAKLGIRTAHVEAGLRSFDRTMPEEINRLLTDQIADILFTPSADGNENLLREGIPDHRIHLVGNVMIDTLVRLLPLATALETNLLDSLKAKNYVLVTLHRPHNVDHMETLEKIVEALRRICQDFPVVFPLHPRTRQRLLDRDLLRNFPENLYLLEPLGYLEFLALQKNAAIVVTDSGGVQEETTFLGVPCLTVRPNTERPITITNGTNRLIEADAQVLVEGVRAILQQSEVSSMAPLPLWDGKTAERIVQVMMETTLSN